MGCLIEFFIVEKSAAKIILFFEINKKKREILQFPPYLYRFYHILLHLHTHYVVGLAIALDEELSVDDVLTNILDSSVGVLYIGHI